MAKRKREENLRDQRVTIQVTKNEKAKIIELAEKEGIDVSDYIRINCIYKPFNAIFEEGKA